MVEEPTIFMTTSEVEAILRRRKEKLQSLIYLDLKPPTSYKSNKALLGAVCYSPIKKFDGRRANTREIVVRFLDQIGGHA